MESSHAVLDLESWRPGHGVMAWRPGHGVMAWRPGHGVMAAWRHGHDVWRHGRMAS